MKKQLYQEAVEIIVAERKAAGDENIFLIKGEEVSDANTLREGDNVHFSIEGASDFANKLHTKITEILSPNTSVEEIKALNTDVYPNPFCNNIVISNLKKNTIIEIVNISGELVKTLKINSQNQEIDLSELLPAVYFVNYSSIKGKKESIKIIKK